MQVLAEGMKAAAVVVSVVFVAGNEAVEACPQFDMQSTDWAPAADLDILELTGLYSVLRALLVIFARPGRGLAQSNHSFHVHDRWNRGYVWEYPEEILTWAERGMPWIEHCRTPLWPKSDREKTLPGLTSPAVHRARCSNCRGGIALRIAWK